MTMRIRRIIDRLDRSKQTDREKGFSLIELIIVIVILGILVAIAIPIYNKIQDTAKENAIKTAASNGASQAVSQMANGQTVSLTNLVSGDVKAVKVANATTPTTDNVCVEASGTSDYSADNYFAGPGANSDQSACNSGV